MKLLNISGDGDEKSDDESPTSMEKPSRLQSFKRAALWGNRGDCENGQQQQSSSRRFTWGRSASLRNLRRTSTASDEPNGFNLAPRASKDEEGSGFLRSRSSRKLSSVQLLSEDAVGISISLPEPETEEDFNAPWLDPEEDARRKTPPPAIGVEDINELAMIESSVGKIRPKRRMSTRR